MANPACGRDHVFQWRMHQRLVRRRHRGLHLPAGKPDYLGVAQDHEAIVFVAKFTEDQDVWHGYPADHRRKHGDIPTEPVLDGWMRDGLLTPANIRKLTRGQPCRL